MTRQEEYKLTRQKILKLNLIAKLFFLIGGILLVQDKINFDFSLLGLALFGIGCYCFIAAKVKRYNKKYRVLRVEEDEENSSWADMVDEFGVSMIIGGIIILLCLFIGGLIFLWYLASFNWFKAFLFFVAFQLVTDWREFNNL